MRREHVEVLLVVEVAEARRPRVHAVERLLEGHLAHVALEEVDLLPSLLRLVLGAGEHGQREIVADDVVAAAGELDGVGAGAAGQVEHDRALLQAEAVLDEVALLADGLVLDLLQRADVVVAEDLLPPGLLPLAARRDRASAR